MGLSLRLLPVDYLSSGTAGCWGNCHTILELGGISWDLGTEIRDRARLLPDAHNVTSHLGTRIKEGPHEGSSIYGTLKTDCYGERYRWLTAEELIVYLDKYFPKDPITAYVRALPGDRLIVLDWH